LSTPEHFSDVTGVGHNGYHGLYGVDSAAISPITACGFTVMAENGTTMAKDG
jgi:hypothetical protein